MGGYNNSIKCMDQYNVGMKIPGHCTEVAIVGRLMRVKSMDWRRVRSKNRGCCREVAISAG